MARSLPVVLAALLALLPVPALRAQDAPSVARTLSFRDALGAVNYGTRVEGALRWAPDGVHLLRGRAWLDPETSKEVEKRPAAEAPAKEEALAELMRQAIAEAAGLASPPSIGIGTRPTFDTLPRHPEPEVGLLASEDGRVAIASVDGDLWAFDAAEGKARRLTTSKAPRRRVALAPNGAHASFIEGYDLHVVDTATGELRRLTKDGGEDLFYGELDWVYQEEVYGRFDFNATWWSPAGNHVAFMRIDESAVATFTVVDHIPNRLELEHLKYPKAGDGNPKAGLLVADARTGAVVPVDLSAYEGVEPLIVRVGWRPDGSEVVFQVQDREQTWLDLNVADPGTGKTRTLFRETSRSWVNVLGMPRWLADQSFLWESERTGYRHLYLYDRDGKLIRPVTAGEWQVRAIHVVDEERGRILFEATKDGAVDRNTYVVGLDGQGLRRLTEGPGTHDVSLSGDGRFLLDTVSTLADPGEQRLVRIEDGSLVRVTGKAPMPRAAETYGFSVPELVSIPARDGYPLDAVVVKPLPFDETKAYPVWLDTYSGPDAPTVQNEWSGNPWPQFLAQNGYVFFQVNVRSASGRGQCHTDRCYKAFGVQELQDLEDAVAWLTGHPWADAARVGITGWSYGGTMTAFALTHSKAFKLGIAGSGVYDWRLYDTIYTERYMRTPQNNPEGYKASSCIEAARNLHGHLLIVHGTMDDNVHFQNALQLAYALQRAGKDFELMPYAKSRHGLDRSVALHYRQLVWKTIKEKL